MSTRLKTFVAALVIVTGMMTLTSGRPAAQQSVALTGMVKTSEEGAMEGVVVTARRRGANFSVTVVTDARGRYVFPRSHVDAGSYTITLRATGYDLVDPGPVEVAAGKTATIDLSLKPAADLSKQLSSREWALSVGGPDDLRATMAMSGESCTYCHSLERIVKSKHNADEFEKVITRMQHYFADGSAAPTGTGRARSLLEDKERLEAIDKSPFWVTGKVGSTERLTRAELGKYLATINLSEGRTTFPFTLKTLPRPKGVATRVIVTAWEIPRKNAVAHDAEVDSKGNVWYNEENADIVGMLNPRTNAFSEYVLERADNGVPGSRDIIVDRHDTVWLPMRVTGGQQTLYKFDPTTKVLTPAEGAKGGGAFGGASPDGSHVWMGFMRVDTKTAKMDGDFRRPPNLTTGQQMGGYGFAVNSQGNPYGTDFGGSRITGVNVAKGEGKFWPMSRVGVFPRRGRIDAQDRFWFGVYGGDAIAMFDTRTEKLTEWSMPTKYTAPYTASVPDSQGFIYSASHNAERLLRLNPKTGEVVEYPMPDGPGNFDTKKMSFDPVSKRTVIYFANTRNAEIFRVEFLD
jgi:streptogramin lyase